MYLSSNRLRASMFIVCLSAGITLVKGLPPHVLIYSRTVGFRHDSIPTAIEALRGHSSSVDVIFELLDDSGKSALQNYLNKGGNFIAVHSASDCLRNTSFYGRELGSYFDYHADLQNATVDVIGPSHPSTSDLPSEWKVVDEMYNFVSDPRSLGAIVVLAANESSYVDNGTRKFNQGSPHPIAWYQEHGIGAEIVGNLVGRSFYTSLGHLNETWQDDLFLSHVLGGLQWVLQSNTTLAFNPRGLVGNNDTELRSASPSTVSPTTILASSSLSDPNPSVP
ncbi:hypothetical protein AN958_12518 [Leucoagaricus sp. SymC.cos]|nr:hypothetical protein AN958_12518 [Leucoagaricus sp. SymC.cos]